MQADAEADSGPQAEPPTIRQAPCHARQPKRAKGHSMQQSDTAAWEAAGGEGGGGGDLLSTTLVTFSLNTSSLATCSELRVARSKSIVKAEHGSKGRWSAPAQRGA